MTQNKGLHHFLIRKRIYEKKEKYPSPNKFRRFFDKLIYAVAIICPLLNLPQLLKIWINKSAEGVSAFSWFGFMGVSLVWLTYGIIHKEKPIIIVNAGIIIAQFLIGLGAVLY
ncbi:MAG: SemiSWEET family transporter [Candidatus Diapherotrites archaeon]